MKIPFEDSFSRLISFITSRRRGHVRRKTVETESFVTGGYKSAEKSKTKVSFDLRSDLRLVRFQVHKLKWLLITDWSLWTESSSSLCGDTEKCNSVHSLFHQCEAPWSFKQKFSPLTHFFTENSWQNRKFEIKKITQQTHYLKENVVHDQNISHQARGLSSRSRGWSKLLQKVALLTCRVRQMVVSSSD